MPLTAVTITTPPDVPGGTTAAFSAPPPEYSATGTVDGLPLKMAYQIDDGPLNQIDISGMNLNNLNWSFTLTDADCPVACNTWYSLIVFAYDDTGSYQGLVDFQRSN